MVGAVGWDIWNFLAVLAGGLGLLGLAGAGWAALRGGLAKETIALYEQQNEALRHEVEDLRSQMAKQAEQIEWLKEMAFGHQAIEDLSAKLDGYHRAVMERRER